LPRVCPPNGEQADIKGYFKKVKLRKHKFVIQFIRNSIIHGIRRLIPVVDVGAIPGCFDGEKKELSFFIIVEGKALQRQKRLGETEKKTQSTGITRDLLGSDYSNLL
jgi:hypothetical protein